MILAQPELRAFYCLRSTQPRLATWGSGCWAFVEACKAPVQAFLSPTQENKHCLLVFDNNCPRRDSCL